MVCYEIHSVTYTKPCISAGWRLLVYAPVFLSVGVTVSHEQPVLIHELARTGLVSGRVTVTLFKYRSFISDFLKMLVFCKLSSNSKQNAHKHAEHSTPGRAMVSLGKLHTTLKELSLIAFCGFTEFCPCHPKAELKSSEPLF